MSPALDSLHDEMANAIMRFAQACQGLMGASKKADEGMDATQEVHDYGEALGSALALAEPVLKAYADRARRPTPSTLAAQGDREKLLERELVASAKIHGQFVAHANEVLDKLHAAEERIRELEAAALPSPAAPLEAAIKAVIDTYHKWGGDEWDSEFYKFLNAVTDLDELTSSPPSPSEGKEKGPGEYKAPCPSSVHAKEGKACPACFGKGWIWVVPAAESDPTLEAPGEKEGDAPTFESEMKALLNRYSVDNSCETPDFILAAYVLKCLDSFRVGVAQRDFSQGRENRNILAKRAPGEKGTEEGK